jgi:hypothetical protein
MGVHTKKETCKDFLSEPPASSATTKAHRIQLRRVTGLTTEHLLNLGLMISTTCERCHNNEETALHIVYECEALAEVRFHHLGAYFMRLSYYHGIPPNKILDFTSSVGLFED